MAKAISIPVNSNKVINAWCSYDMANSGYTLCIATVLYPVFFEGMTHQAFGSEMLSFMGFSIKNTVLYEYATSLGYLIAVILSLLLAGIADKQGYRKRFLSLFTGVGAIACVGMYWFDGCNLSIGIAMPTLAIIGFVCSFVYYNSFLPLLVSPDRYDAISARGYSFGYGGSMLLLVFILFQIEFYEIFGFNSANEAVRMAFVEVGVWWLVVSQIALYYLKDNPQRFKLNKELFLHGFKQSADVFKEIKENSSQYRYLLAFFSFIIGVQTTMVIAALIVSVELHLDQSKLILAIILVQFTGIMGASFTGKFASMVGDRKILLGMITVWILICLSGLWIQTGVQFFCVAAITGFVMGGIQSQSRAIWSKFVPARGHKTASYFSFYESAEKLAIVVGMFSFGMIDKLTGSLRLGMVSLSLFFALSFIIILFTELKPKLKENY